ncbi:hypothetical protein GCM10027299_18280 [Larkinella ripae]
MKIIRGKNTVRTKWFVLLVSLFYFTTLPQTAESHVGSSGVIVQKKAGNYQFLISIKPPDVVPGTASVTVFVETGRVRSIGTRPIYFGSGDEGAPTHDVLTTADGSRYEGEVWLMASGSSSIELSIDGPDGKQQVVIPVMAIATAMREMPKGTGLGLAAMGLLLVVMLITIIGACNADGMSVPNQAAPVTLKRQRSIGMGIGLFIIVLTLAGWRSWWNSTADNYRTEQLYRPASIQTSVRVANAHRQLTIQFDTSADRHNRRNLSYIVPDHGKLMHTFLVRIPGLDAFTHLHPNRRDTIHYETAIPPLPEGKYLLYSDVVYRSGFAETLTDTVYVPSVNSSTREVVANAEPSGPYATDDDDSWHLSEPMGVKEDAVNVPHLSNDVVICGKPGASTRLADGSVMLWMDKPSQVLESGKLYTLKFAVADSLGKAADLEPYLGMSGHATILRSDGTVYIHLHPIGTYSMAAEESLVNRIADTTRTFHYPDATLFRDSIDRYVAKLKTVPGEEKNRLLQVAMPGMNHLMKANNMVEFPYAFPKAGHYRIWVQVKRNGEVLTAVFDTQVNDPLL